MSHNISEELDLQNELLDNLKDKMTLTDDILKDNNNKIDKII